MDSSYRDWAWLPQNLLASIEEKLDKTMTITLLNPFTNGVITLPALNDPLGEFEYRIDNYPDYFVVKGILSLDPLLSPNNYEVVVIYGGMGRLASLKSGNNSWNFINLGQDYVFVDIIYHKGQVFAIDSWSKLVRIEVASEATNYRVMTGRSNRCAQVAYLVESQEGDLLMVQRFWKNRKTFEFKVFKLVYRIGEAHVAAWAHVKNIGDQALFLGDNHSVSISTMEFSSCQPNCIYYTDQNHNHIPPYAYHGVDDDSGVFNLVDGSFHSHYVSDPSEKHILPPIWNSLIFSSVWKVIHTFLWFTSFWAWGLMGHPKDPLLRIGQCPDSCYWSCSWQSPRSRPVSRSLCRSQCGSDRQHESIGCLGFDLMARMVGAHRRVVMTMARAMEMGCRCIYTFCRFWDVVLM
ncbi:hypothetical protein Acr_00g0096770 [Actinidia rufa]|uniref:KIB1-4 beta-propeller domain-containing protein n=1 Tax=Actinidia rufa TaxID=165716 RepID=A0A7J0DZD0_9ERIC|nr:hypothetical protein Acr_00g0096770 [Actinidia rufa]